MEEDILNYLPTVMFSGTPYMWMNFKKKESILLGMVG